MKFLNSVHIMHMLSFCHKSSNFLLIVHFFSLFEKLSMPTIFFSVEPNRAFFRLGKEKCTMKTIFGACQKIVCIWLKSQRKHTCYVDGFRSVCKRSKFFGIFRSNSILSMNIFCEKRAISTSNSKGFTTNTFTQFNCIK